MDAEEEEEEDEDDIDGDITSQSEADQSAINMADIIQSASSSKNTSQSEVSMQMDVSDVGGEDEQEDKENSSSLASSGDHSNNVWYFEIKSNISQELLGCASRFSQAVSLCLDWICRSFNSSFFTLYTYNKYVVTD